MLGATAGLPSSENQQENPVLEALLGKPAVALGDRESVSRKRDAIGAVGTRISNGQP